MRTLDELVAAFTTERTEPVWEKPEDGPKQLVTRRLPALLDLLDDAVHGSNSGHGGGASSKMTIPITADAMQLQSEIMFAVKADIVRLSPEWGNRQRPDALKPFTTLRDRMVAWLALFTDSHPLAGEVASWQESFETWAEQIETMLDPPVTVEILADCPVCGRRRGRTEDADFHALCLVYRRDSAATSSQIICRACEEVIASGQGAIGQAATQHGWRGLQVG